MRIWQRGLLAGTALVSVLSVQYAVAADLPRAAPVLAPVLTPVVSRWDGFYIGFSAGGSWSKGEEAATSTESSRNVFSSFAPPGVLADQFVQTQTEAFSSAASGNNAGAVFTFTAGYNWVWGPWVTGVQSEVSWNENNIRLRGSGASSFVQTSQSVFPVVGPVSTETGSQSFTTETNLENQWTASIMGKFGYLVAPDWLVYGLLGYSWGGWEADTGQSPFVLSGITYGVGIEKDFGWLRTFVQYKGINYSSKTIDNSFSNSFQSSNSGFSQVSTSTTSGTRTFSADVQQITLGLTIPLGQIPLRR